MQVEDPVIANLPDSQTTQSDELADAAYLPATHSSHADTSVRSVRACAVPEGQSSHVVAPISEYVPLSQSVHETDPAVAENVPAAHFSWSDFAVFVLKPESASVHTADSAAAYQPRLQSPQDADSADACLPASQIEQLSLLAASCFPIGQTVQAEAPAKLYLPSAQSPHAPDPAEAENLPATHTSQSLFSVTGTRPG